MEECTQSSTKGFGKSPTIFSRGTNCKSRESSGFQACRVRSPFRSVKYNYSSHQLLSTSTMTITYLIPRHLRPSHIFHAKDGSRNYVENPLQGVREHVRIVITIILTAPRKLAYVECLMISRGSLPRGFPPMSNFPIKRL